MTKFKVVAGTDMKGRKPAAAKPDETPQQRPWITKDTIKRLRADPRAECREPDGDKSAEGFGLRKRTNGDGTVSLFFNFAARLANGKTANIALGTVGVETIDAMREQARKLRKWVDRGLDPRVMLAEEEAANRAKEAAADEAEVMTLGHAIRLKVESPALREGTKKQYRALISPDSKVSLRHLEHKRLDAISKNEWRAILKKVRDVYGPDSPQPAVIRRAVAALYRNAVAESDFLKLDNPITELRRAEFADPKNRRTDRINANNLAAWFRQLNHHHETIANLAKLYLLTGMRDREARHLTWSEVHPDAIRLPSDRTKTGHELLLPRTPAIDVLLAAQEQYKAKTSYVFPAVLPRPGDDREERWKRPVSSILPVLSKLGCSVHGMRRTAATFMDQLGVPENIRRHLLNHAPDISRGYVVRDLNEMRKWLRQYHDWIKEQLEHADRFDGMPEPTEAEWREMSEHYDTKDREAAADWAGKLKVAAPKKRTRR